MKNMKKDLLLSVVRRPQFPLYKFLRSDSIQSNLSCIRPFSALSFFFASKMATHSHIFISVNSKISMITSYPMLSAPVNCTKMKFFLKFTTNIDHLCYMNKFYCSMQSKTQPNTMVIYLFSKSGLDTSLGFNTLSLINLNIKISTRIQIEEFYISIE